MSKKTGSGCLHFSFVPSSEGENLGLLQIVSSPTSADNASSTGEDLMPRSQPKQGCSPPNVFGADLFAITHQSGAGRVSVQPARSNGDSEVPWEAAWAHIASSDEAAWNEHWSDKQNGTDLDKGVEFVREEFNAIEPSILIEDYDDSESSWSGDDDDDIRDCSNNSTPEAKPRTAEIAPILPPGRAAAAAWVAFRVRRCMRMILRSFYLRWALEATNVLDCTAAADDDKAVIGCTSASPNEEVTSEVSLDVERAAWDSEVDAEVLAMQREVATEFVRRLSPLKTRLASRRASPGNTTNDTTLFSCRSTELLACQVALQKWQAATAALMASIKVVESQPTTSIPTSDVDYTSLSSSVGSSPSASKTSSVMISELEAADAQLGNIAALIARLESVGKANDEEDNGDSDKDEDRTNGYAMGISAATKAEQQDLAVRESRLAQSLPPSMGQSVVFSPIEAKKCSGNEKEIDGNEVGNDVRNEEMEKFKAKFSGKESDLMQSTLRRVRFDETTAFEAKSDNTVHTVKERRDDILMPMPPQQSAIRGSIDKPTQMVAQRRSASSRAAWAAFDDDDEDLAATGVAAAEERLRARQRAQVAAKRAFANATEGAEAKAQKEIEASRAETARAEAAARVARRRRREQIARAEAAKAMELAAEYAALSTRASLSACNSVSEADVEGISSSLHPNHDNDDIAAVGRQAAAQRVAATKNANGMSAARAAALEILVAEHARDAAEHALKGAGPGGCAIFAHALEFLLEHLFQFTDGLPSSLITWIS